MSAAPDIECGFEFPARTFSVTKADQERKLNCSGIDPALYGDQLEIAMLEANESFEVVETKDILDKAHSEQYDVWKHRQD